MGNSQLLGVNKRAFLADSFVVDSIVDSLVNNIDSVNNPWCWLN